MKKKFIFILSILVLISGITSLILLNKLDKKKEKDHNVEVKDEKEDNVTSYDDYVYKITMNIGLEGDVYLFSNDEVRVITKDEVYEVEDGCNCLKSTGEIVYDNFKIDFSNENLKEAIEVIKEIGQKANKKDINVRDLELTDYQGSVILALILNNEPIMDEAKNEK